MLAVVPSSPGRPEATVRGELGALQRPQVILTLLVGVVGFGGMFALYSYIAPVVTDVAGLSRGTVPLGAARLRRRRRRRDGAGRPARRLALFRSLVATLVVLGVLLALVALISPWAPGLFVGVFLVSIAASALAICLQMRLMETAGEAQMLGAALNHSALNLANALGAWLGGLVIAAGLGYRAPSVVGAGLAAAGLIPLAASARAAPPARAAVPAPVARRRRARGARRGLIAAATPVQRCRRPRAPAAFARKSGVSGRFGRLCGAALLVSAM